MFLEVTGAIFDDVSDVRPYVIPFASVAGIGRLPNGKAILHLSGLDAAGEHTSIWTIEYYDDIRRGLSEFILEAEPVR